MAYLFMLPNVINRNSWLETTALQEIFHHRSTFSCIFQNGQLSLSRFEGNNAMNVLT